MRRKDRELTKEEAELIIKNTPHAVLSMIDTDGKPYATPFSPVMIDGKLYFHGTNTAESQRKQALLKNPEVMVTFVGLSDNDVAAIASSFSVNYASASVRGKAKLIADPQVKESIAKELAKIQFPMADEPTVDKAYAGGGNYIDVWEISIESVTGKSRNKHLYFDKLHQ